MVTVPKFNREVAPQFTENRYLQDYSSPEAFGVNISKAKAETGKAMGNLADNIGNILVKIKDRVDDTKIIGMANHSYEWEQANLYDKENGYYNKLGQDAYGQSETLIKDYNAYMDEYIRKAKLSPDALRRAQSTLLNLRSKVERGVTEHDFKQGAKWANDEAELGKSNYINNAINQRNNPEEIEKSLASGYQLIEWQGEIQNLDRTAIDLLKMQFRQGLKSKVLENYIADKSLKAKEYLEANKADINPDKMPVYTNAIRDNELKYNSEAMANKLMLESKNEQEAILKAEKIKDPDLRDNTILKIKRKGDIPRYAEALDKQETLKNFYDNAWGIIQNGGFVSIDDIPSNLDGETKLSLLNFVNKNGQTDDDNSIWEELYEKSVNDAQGFAQLDLNQYRGFLSDGQYQSFIKKQEEIKTGKYYSYIADDDKMINDALKAVNVQNRMFSDKTTNVAFSEIKSMVREFEARKGRAITDDELMNITESLGYKDDSGVQLYKYIEKGMGERVGFIKGVINDFVYYQNKHNGEMPSDEEKRRIILKRMGMLQDQRKNEAEKFINNFTNGAAYLKNIINIQAKPNEQKTLTYFADKRVPELSKQLGIELNVTDRYRKPNGKYKSHHSEGRALDIGYRTKGGTPLTLMQKMKLVEAVLRSPEVEAIGISTADSDGREIMKYINKNYGKTYANKIQDMNKKDSNGKTRDENLKTNHTTHVHITVKSDGAMTTQKPKIAQNGAYKF